MLRRLSGGKRCLELGSSALVIEGQGPTLLLSCWLPLQGTALVAELPDRSKSLLLREALVICCGSQLIHDA